MRIEEVEKEWTIVARKKSEGFDVLTLVRRSIKENFIEVAACRGRNGHYTAPCRVLVTNITAKATDSRFWAAISKKRLRGRAAR